MGSKKTYNRIKQHFFWPGMAKDVKLFVKTCLICQKTIQKGRIPVAPLGSVPIIGVAFEKVAIDLIGPIEPPSTEGHRYILTLMDYATRYPEAAALKDKTAETVANALISFFSRLGIPKEILSDQGRQFTSEIMKNICKTLSIK